ncbi:YfbM family protein [Exiguobacterium sp. SL-10]|nr:YfbM family protein [Exiguobacterium sp. SL-10]
MGMIGAYMRVSVEELTALLQEREMLVTWIG